MGSSNFETVVNGATLDAAFDAARQEARYWHGHGGYSGTVAEKPGATLCGTAREGATDREISDAISKWTWAVERLQTATFYATQGWNHEPFEELRLLEAETAEALRQLVPNVDLERVYALWADKWSDAIAVRLGADEWLLTGLAST